MSFWSVQGAERCAVLLATLFIFTYQVDDRAEAEAGPGTSLPASAQAPLRTPSTPVAGKVRQPDDRDHPDAAAYLCLLASAIIVARQIRKRGHTHITLS